MAGSVAVWCAAAPLRQPPSVTRVYVETVAQAAALLPCRPPCACASSHATMSCTATAPEHGPPNYQQTVPYTRQPLASIWEINHWIALRQQVGCCAQDNRRVLRGRGQASCRALTPSLRLLATTAETLWHHVRPGEHVQCPAHRGRVDTAARKQNNAPFIVCLGLGAHLNDTGNRDRKT